MSTYSRPKHRATSRQKNPVADGHKLKKQQQPIVLPFADPLEKRHVLAETARLLLCVLVSALGFYVIALLCHSFYHPDILSIVEESKTLLPAHLISGVQPEPLENLLYNVALIYFPLSMLSLYAVCTQKRINRFLSRPNISTTIIYFACMVLLVVGVFVLSQPNPLMAAIFRSQTVSPQISMCSLNLCR